MATYSNGTVTQVRADTSVSPTAYSATVTYPNPSPPPPTITIDHTGLPKDHYDNFQKALGTSLKVDTTTDGSGNTTGTTVHT